MELASRFPMAGRIPDSLSCFLDSKAPDSGFLKQNFPDSTFLKQEFLGLRYTTLRMESDEERYNGS